MKKILSLLASISLISTGIVTPTSILLNSIQRQDVEDYSPDSFQNVIKIMNLANEGTTKEILENSKEVGELITNYVPDYYESAFNGKKGVIRSWEMKAIDDEQVLFTFNDTFSNNSSYEQIYNTESYSREIVNTHTFSMSITEITSKTTNIGGSFTIPFLNSGIGGEAKHEMHYELQNNKQWSDSEEEAIIVTAPSQAIKTSAHSVLRVSYVVKQGIYNSRGVVNFEVEDLEKETFNIPHFFFKEDGSFDYVTWEMKSVLEIIDAFKKTGYIDQFKNNSTKYSVITMDDIENPTKIYLNLPISWKSQGGQIQVTHYEEPLK